MVRRTRSNSLRRVSVAASAFSRRADLRQCVVRHAGGIEQVGQGAGARGIDEHAPYFAQRVVTGGACDGKRGLERLVDGEDLLDDDPRLRPGQLAQPLEIACGIGQSVRVVDAHAVHQSLAEPAPDLDVGCVENRAVLLAESGQRGDGEESPIPAPPASPSGQPIVLTGMDFRSPTPNRCPARSDTPDRPAAARHRRPRDRRCRRRNPAPATRFARRRDPSRYRNRRSTRNSRPCVSTSHHHGFC